MLWDALEEAFRHKLHAVVDTQGRPLHIALTAGQRHEMMMADELLEAAHGNGDRERVRLEPISRSDTPRKGGHWLKTGAAPPPKRYLVERFFHELKRFRAIATRYEKTACSYLALIHLACARLWLEN